MDFLELAKSRYSLRQYSSRPVEKEKLQRILEAAAAAPTGCNLQPQRIMVADDPAVLAKIRQTTNYQFNAPVTMVICYEDAACWHNKFGEGVGETDAAIVITHMILQAAELGLGSCWVACFDWKVLKEVLNIPEGFRPVALLPLGYPADNAQPAGLHFKRKTPDQFTWRNHF